jgi:hypothetical protein
MFNLGLGDQSKGGSLLDTVLQIAFPAYGLMRNAQGLFDPDSREGTLTGWGMNKMEEPGGFFGSDQPQGDGVIGNGFVSTNDGYDTYNYGNEDIGVEHTSGSSAQSDYSNVSWGDMTEEEASSWDDY